MLRSFAQTQYWQQGSRMGTHSLRRGAARAILESGGPFFQLLRSGQWPSSAYELCLDLGREETGAVASILIEASDED